MVVPGVSAPFNQLLHRVFNSIFFVATSVSPTAITSGRHPEFDSALAYTEKDFRYTYKYCNRSNATALILPSLCTYNTYVYI